MRTFVRAKGRDGHPVRGIYVRDGQFHAGYSKNGHWHIKQLKAQDIDEARIERKRLVKQAGAYLSHEDRRLPEPRLKMLDELHSDARKLAQRVSRAKLHLSHRENRALLDEAEWMTGRAAELIFSAWRTSQ